MHDPTSQPIMMIDSSPPLLHHFGELARLSPQIPAPECNDLPSGTVVMKECRQLPLIDLGCLNSTTERERLACAEAICRASSEWGFFQVVNHGISPELVRNMRREQVKLFQTPFDKKATCGVLNNSYRWGTPTATCPKQFSWSEAFHIPLSKVSEQACYGEFSSLREVMVEFSAAMSKLARVLAGVLAGNLGHPRGVFENICQENNCFLRLNRYPACPVSPEISGLVPHTDSDFLTILSQDEVGGLQLMKDSKWVAVNPNQDALIVNIGDLFQAWSNDVYRSVEHKVVAHGKLERFSIAYFLCPSYDSLIGSCNEPSLYREFTFREYRSPSPRRCQKNGPGSDPSRPFQILLLGLTSLPWRIALSQLRLCRSRRTPKGKRLPVIDTYSCLLQGLDYDRKSGAAVVVAEPSGIGHLKLILPRSRVQYGIFRVRNFYLENPTDMLRLWSTVLLLLFSDSGHHFVSKVLIIAANNC
ncbi:hypothetical protein OIU84_018952 [Salix udensis]|uniref:Fe2OG dioxygenase domain-containing protein n=1 Tax=Salix udensis TaxID=889485 RepID=A0AAD6KZM4_9ROSI|nr:hypothetical protein OIU84_018952 [Salix udensis]